MRGEGRGSGEEDKEEGISREKKGAIRRLKDGKAAGIDRIPGEVWRYGAGGRNWR